MAFVAVEKLDIYRLAEELADTVWNMVSTWDNFARGTVGAQLVRCADSVGANIAEGAGRGSTNDNRRFVRIARGSLLESRFHLRRAFKRNLVSASDVELLKPLFDQLLPKLNSYHRAIGRKKVRPSGAAETQNT
jgi:four helix bundle protein